MQVNCDCRQFIKDWIRSSLTNLNAHFIFWLSRHQNECTTDHIKKSKYIMINTYCSFPRGPLPMAAITSFVIISIISLRPCSWNRTQNTIYQSFPEWYYIVHIPETNCVLWMGLIVVWCTEYLFRMLKILEYVFWVLEQLYILQFHVFTILQIFLAIFYASKRIKMKMFQSTKFFWDGVLSSLSKVFLYYMNLLHDSYIHKKRVYQTKLVSQLLNQESIRSILHNLCILSLEYIFYEFLKIDWVLLKY